MNALQELCGLRILSLASGAWSEALPIWGALSRVPFETVLAYHERPGTLVRPSVGIEMSRCTAQTASGQPCQARALKGGNLCFFHSSDQQHARSQARQHGGQRQRVDHAGDRSKLPAEVRTVEHVLAVLDYTLMETLASENSIQRGRLIVALAGAYMEAFKAGDFDNRLPQFRPL